VSLQFNCKKKHLYLGPFLFFAFVNMAAGNLHALQAALLLPPDVRRCAIFRTPISALLEGLLSKRELASSLFAPDRSTNIENAV
jgi:hypothetical protein